MNDEMHAAVRALVSRPNWAQELAEILTDDERAKLIKSIDARLSKTK